MFDRETRREKYVEAKHRELKNKQQTKSLKGFDDFEKKAELTREDIERDITYVVEKMVNILLE